MLMIIYDRNVGNKEHSRRWGDEEYRGLNNIKTPFPTFKGSSGPDKYLEWEMQMKKEV